MNKVPVYEGTASYLFVSYAHANAPAVMQVAEELTDAGYRIWYDDGIEVGSEWPEYIASHLAGAGLMVAFISNAYMRSDNCRKEMHFALGKKIPVISIFLEETALTPGMEMQIGSLFALMKYTMRDEVFYEKLLAAPQLTEDLRGTAPVKKKRKRPKAVVDVHAEAARRKSKKRRRVIASLLLAALLIALSVLGLVGWMTGFLQSAILRQEQVEIAYLAPETPAVFTAPALERIARDYTGTDGEALCLGNLAGLRELELSGADITEAALAELRYFPDLQTLSLTDIPLYSLRALQPCGIESLSISGGVLMDLEGIENLPRLQTLHVSGCPVRSLQGLGRCLELRTLVLRGGNVHDFTPLRPLRRLAEVELDGCTLNELRPVLKNSAMSDLTLVDCDLRGRFFRAFDRESALVSLSLTDCRLNSTANLEDFTGLAELTLVRSGENLDFSVLADLPSLRTVYTHAAAADAMAEMLRGSDIRVETVE